jgi:hypothetical protein
MACTGTTLPSTIIIIIQTRLFINKINFQKPLSLLERREETVAGKKNTGICINSEIINPLSKFPVFKSKIRHPQQQNMKGDCIC